MLSFWERMRNVCPKVNSYNGPILNNENQQTVRQVPIFRRHSDGTVWSLDSKGSVSTIVVVGRRAGHRLLLCVESPRGMESERLQFLASTS